MVGRRDSFTKEFNQALEIAFRFGHLDIRVLGTKLGTWVLRCLVSDTYEGIQKHPGPLADIEGCG